MNTTENKTTETNKTAEAFTIKGDWTVQAAQLKEKYAQLTDADLKFEAGKEQELVGRIATKLGKKNEEVIDILKKGQLEKA